MQKYAHFFIPQSILPIFCAFRRKIHQVVVILHLFEPSFLLFPSFPLLMKRPLRRTLISVVSIFLFLALLLLVADNYLLNYALRPCDRSRKVEQAWLEMDSVHAGLIAWRDSLKRAGAWRDTTVNASDGTPLHAYYIKSSQPRALTAVLVHGYTDCAVRMMHIGRMYERRLEANLLVPDLRNAGESGGDAFQMGWLDRLDVKQWIDLAPCLFGDTVRIVVRGVSMGAATTVMLSGEKDLPSRVTHFIEDCGYTSVDAQFSKELKEQFGLPRFPLIPSASVLCGWRFGWRFSEASALEAVKRCERPMFFIHGDADRYVPTSMVYPLYQAHTGEKALWVTPGVPHARSYEYFPEEYTRRVKDFIEKE